MFKIAHIHIPKTGGKYVELQAFKHTDNFLNLGHKGFVRFDIPNDGDERYDMTCLDYDLTDYVVFAVVRNPFEILVSSYFHDYSGQNGWDNCRDRFEFDTFEKYVIDYCDTSKKFYRPMHGKFLFWQMFDESGKCRADFIIKNEKLDEGLTALGDITGVRPVLGDKIGESSIKRDKGIRRDYRNYYSNDMIRMVNEKCNRELKSFEYDFYGSTSNKIFIDCKDYYNPITDEWRTNATS